MLTYKVLRDRYKNLRKSHEDIYNELIRADKEIKHLNKQLNQALKDYDELQEKIDKAIEYINKYEYQRYCPSPCEKEKYIMREEKEGKDLLDILRGD